MIYGITLTLFLGEISARNDKGYNVTNCEWIVVKKLFLTPIEIRRNQR